jgi:hypothetical protein
VAGISGYFSEINHRFRSKSASTVLARLPEINFVDEKAAKAECAAGEQADRLFP